MTYFPDALGWDEYGVDMEIVVRGRGAFVLPVIPDDAPDVIREGIARRRLVVLEHRCPCGERWTPPTDARPGEHRPVTIAHRDHCPAISKRMLRALRKWRNAA